MATPDSSPDSTAQEPAPNSIRQSERKRRGTNAATPEPERLGPPPKTPASQAVPEEIARRFVQVRNKYYFPDGARAFTDRGNRITTNSENTEVVRSLIEIAKARAWQEITVRGTERFRKEVWIAASVAGLQVRGYKPTEFEQSHLVRTLAREKTAPIEPAANSLRSDADSISRGAVGEETGARSGGRFGADRAGLMTGKLIDHGRATYQHDPHAGMSYFVKLETSRGDRVIWGVDLERAVKESLTKPEPGDEVALRSVRQDAVTVKTPTRDAEGQVTGEQDLNTHRNRWIIEKREFFEARAAAAQWLRDSSVPAKEVVRQHPELVGTYLQMHAAELAAKRFRDPEDRALFVSKVRAALAESVARGEPLPAVRLRERPKVRTPDAREREPEPTRG